jgi:hypothetical protein
MLHDEQGCQSATMLISSVGYILHIKKNRPQLFSIHGIINGLHYKLIIN